MMENNGFFQEGMVRSLATPSQPRSNVLAEIQNRKVE